MNQPVNRRVARRLLKQALHDLQHERDLVLIGPSIAEVRRVIEEGPMAELHLLVAVERDSLKRITLGWRSAFITKTKEIGVDLMVLANIRDLEENTHMANFFFRGDVYVEDEDNDHPVYVGYSKTIYEVTMSTDGWRSTYTQNGFGHGTRYRYPESEVAEQDMAN
jgi:hypothetical protein